MAKPCTPHLHCAARAVIQATDCQCRGSRGSPLAFSRGIKRGILSFVKESIPLCPLPCAAQGNKEQRWRAEISDAQTIESAQCIDHRKNNDRAEVGGRIILVEPRGDLADIEPADLARAQHMLD